MLILTRHSQDWINYHRAPIAGTLEVTIEQLDAAKVNRLNVKVCINMILKTFKTDFLDR
jgi:hypothetical protein